MPLPLSSIAKKRATTYLIYDNVSNKLREATEEERRQEEVLKIQFYPNGFTPRLEAELVSLQENSVASSQTFCNMLADNLLASWDLMGDDGQPIKITSENLMGLPTPLLLAIIEEIMQALRPGETNSVTSNAGSEKADILALAQTGTW
jgi:hypothetical protein